MYKQFWIDRLNNARLAGEEIVSDCPECKKNRHFYVNVKTGQFDCKKCHFTGNAITYLRDYEHIKDKQIAECLNSYDVRKNNSSQYIIAKSPKIFDQNAIDLYVSRLSTDRLKEISKERGLSEKILKRYKIGLDRENNFTLPVYDEKGEIRDIRRKRIGSDTISSKGASVFLFGIKDLLSNTRIFITEGEWSKMALEAQGYASVGVPGASVFKDEWVPYFKDKEVYIVYDLDDGGKQGTKRVVDKLNTIAKEIRIIHLPEELGEGKDVRNFFSNGYTKEDFERLIDGAEVLKKEEDVMPLSLPEFMKQDIPPLEYYASGVLPKKGKGMISAHANIGKSLFCQSLALAIARGEKQFLDKFDISPAKVLYLDLEMGKSALKQRFQNMTQEYPPNLYLEYLPSINLLDKESQILLEKWLVNLKIEVLIIDPMGNAWFGDPNNQQEVGQLTAYLNTLIEKYGISILVVHHWRKSTKDFKKGGQMAAGSYRWEAWLDCHITLEGMPKSIIISCQKSRNMSRFSSFLAKINEDSLCFEFLADYEKKYDETNLCALFDGCGLDRVAIPDLIKRAKDQDVCSPTTMRNLIKKSTQFEIDKSEKTHYLIRKGTKKDLLDSVTL